MKKLIVFLFIFSITFASAQTYQPLTKVQKNRDDFTFTIKVNDTEKIDWRFVREVFSDKKHSDSLQISVVIESTPNSNLISEKKYTVRGLKKNLEEFILYLDKMITKENNKNSE